MSLAGNTFFYQNPLESNGRAKRSDYFEVACCPANLARMLEQLPGLVYAQTADTIYANLYVGNHATVKLGNRTIEDRARTRAIPGTATSRCVSIPKARGAFTVALRIPGWSRDQPVPSDLYRFADSDERRADGDRPQPAPRRRCAYRSTSEDGYVRIKRNWKRGDTIHLTLPMSPRRIVAHADVKDDDGKVALQRGPLVYALEADRQRWPRARRRSPA